MSRAVGLTVAGVAAPAGSKRGFNHGGRVVITDANPNSRLWKAQVSSAALQAMMNRGEDGVVSGYLPPLEGPLGLSLVFFVPRPKGHYGKRGVLPSAPAYPAVRPDVLKLARAVEDALSGIVYRDDAQIVTERLEKRYGEPARVDVIAWNITPKEDT